MSAVLELEGVDAAYGQAQILFGVSLNLREGEVVALIGRNGAGKSTLMKTVIGLVRRSRGSIRFLGAEIGDLPSYRIARAGLGYVPEDRRVFAGLTVLENLEAGRQPAREGKQAWTPERLFEIFPNLATLRHRPAEAMSGGEQQMLTIARCLMGNPVAILLDEPSEGLAPLIVQQMAQATKLMQEAGVAVLLSEQNARFTEAIANRAYRIERGLVREA